MKHQTQQLRAVIWPLLNPDTGVMYCDTFSWKELEAEREAYSFDKVAEALERAKRIKRFSIIRVTPEAPEWSTEPISDYLKLIAALGRKFGGERTIHGIDMMLPQQYENIDEAACVFFEAFPYAYKYVYANSTLAALADKHDMIGLIVERQNAEQFAEYSARLPLRTCVNVSSEDEINEAIQRHISVLETDELAASNSASHAGYRFQIRCIDLEDSSLELGEVKVTIEFANAGTLPCYSEAYFHVRLNGSDVDYVRDCKLQLKVSELKPNESISTTQIINTKGMPSGEYNLEIGLFTEGSEYPISFGVEGRISDGYYEGRLILCIQ